MGNCGSGCGEEMVVDVGSLGPDIEAMVFDRVEMLSNLRSAETQGDCRAAGGIVEGLGADTSAEDEARGFSCALPPSPGFMRARTLRGGDFLGAFVPRDLDPAQFLFGHVTGAAFGEGVTRGVSEFTDIRPIWLQLGAAVASGGAHLLAKSDFTFGLFTGTLPLLIASGVDAVVDLIVGEGGGAAMSGSRRMSGGQAMGQLSRRSVEEIKRLLNRLQPSGAGVPSRPRVQAGVSMATPNPQLAGPGMEMASSVFPTAA